MSTCLTGKPRQHKRGFGGAMKFAPSLKKIQAQCRHTRVEYDHETFEDVDNRCGYVQGECRDCGAAMEADATNFPCEGIEIVGKWRLA